MGLLQKSNQACLDNKKERKSGRVALILSVLFHGTILLLIGGVVLIPAVVQKSAFTGDGNQSGKIDVPMDSPPDASNLQNDLPATQAPHENMAMPDKEVPAMPTDIVISRQDSSVATASWASSVTSKVNSQTPVFGGGGGTGAPGGGSGEGSDPSSERKVTVGSRMTLFGSTSKDSGSHYGLEGYLYDLKQDPERKPNEMKGVGNNLDFGAMLEKEKKENAEAGKVMIQFVKSGYRDSEMRKYYRVRNPLYLSFMMIPEIQAELAPKEFGVEKEVAPRRWVVRYTGKISPKESGRYRFYGIADDLMFASINGKIVLNGSLSNYPGLNADEQVEYFEPEKKAKRNPELYDPSNPEQWRRNTYPRIGKWVQMNEGQNYIMDIMIAEIPGGSFRAQLLVEKEDVQYEKNTDSFPILPVFMLNESKVTSEIRAMWKKIPYKFLEKDGPIFTTVE